MKHLGVLGGEGAEGEAAWKKPLKALLDFLLKPFSMSADTKRKINDNNRSL